MTEMLNLTICVYGSEESAANWQSCLRGSKLESKWIL